MFRTEKATDKYFQELYEVEFDKLMTLYQELTKAANDSRIDPRFYSQYPYWKRQAQDVYWKIWELDLIFPTVEEYHKQNEVNLEDLI